MEPMAEEPRNQQREKLRQSVAGIIQEGFRGVEKKEMEAFVDSLDPMTQNIKELIDTAKKETADLRLSMFKHKIALISFNGVILTHMVARKGKIHFGLLALVLLFLSMIVGLIQMTVYYFKTSIPILPASR